MKLDLTEEEISYLRRAIDAYAEELAKEPANYLEDPDEDPYDFGTKESNFGYDLLKKLTVVK